MAFSRELKAAGLVIFFFTFPNVWNLNILQLKELRLQKPNTRSFKNIRAGKPAPTRRGDQWSPFNLLFAGEGTTIGILPDKKFGARPAALTAWTAAVSGPDSMDYNPAGLFSDFQNEFKTEFIRGAADSIYSGVLFTRGISPGETVKKKNKRITLYGGSLSFSVKYFNAGEIVLLDLPENISKTVNAQTDFLLSAGLSHLLIERKLFAGAMLKYYDSTLIKEYNAKSVVFDAGLIYDSGIFGFRKRKIRASGLKAGLAARNFGVLIKKYLTTGEALPSEIRGGFSYDLALNEINNLSLNADSVFRFSRGMNFCFGLEYNYQNLYVRGGYELSGNVAPLRLGLGFIYNLVSLDISYSPTEKFGGLFGVTLGLGMNPGRKKIPEVSEND